MTTLDMVMEMQKNGMTDTEISRTLMQQGVSPQEINDAINQAKIKSALDGSPQINAMQEQQMEYPQPQQNYPQYPEPQSQQQQYPQQEQYYPQQYPAEQYQEQPQQYADDQYYAQQGIMSTETITQIAEQVVKEAFKDYNKKTGDVATFKSITEDKVKDIEDRIRRIENIIDKLQQSIIQKIGEFGENSSTIKKDIENLHEITSKLMNPLIDNYRELQKKRK